MINSIKTRLIHYLERPVRLDILNKWLSKPSVKVLDVGCGNHSASMMKKCYPHCRYWGLDKSKYYNNDAEDFRAMEDFYEIDLNSNSGSLNAVSDDFFDCIIFSHTIEHLENGQDILLRLLPKLKKNGIIYIETPSPRSIHLPNMGIGLNFYSDPTHIRIYPINQIKHLLQENGFSIMKSGTRRLIKRILFLPLYIIGSITRYKYLSAGVFYDITGFAIYIIASKN